MSLWGNVHGDGEEGGGAEGSESHLLDAPWGNKAGRGGLSFPAVIHDAS